MKALQREGTNQRLHITAKSQIPESERVEAKKHSQVAIKGKRECECVTLITQTSLWHGHLMLTKDLATQV
ncbi:hypothetical protein VNO80_20573 [Phaseolus coccineus]|uniref:Uncharacterized protein n=1 Tax=Phaseolus coccineus TaxID=3886 RepID=A0AAN9M0T4_PHACN